METLKHIIKKFDIDVTKKSPFHIKCGRYDALPELFNELGFTVGAEVGVYRGRYTKALCQAMPNLKLYGIDLWEQYPGYKDYDGNINDLSDAHKDALQRTAGLNCEFRKGWSNQVVEQFKDESLDFVFIDGNHAYEYVVTDLANWSKKVKKGGIICGHDFDRYSRRNRNLMHVVDAVQGWCYAYGIHPWFVLHGNKNKCWMYVKE